MNVRPLCTLTAVGALLAPVLWTATAHAQQGPDGARFRGGAEVEVGAVISGGAALGSFLVRGQLGAQINNNWGVYGVPSLGGVFGHGAGPAIGFGAMADYTFDSLPISVGAGPEAGAFIFASTATVCAGGFCAASAAAGAGAAAYYGVMLRGTWYPVLAKGENGIRRKALAVGLDLHLDGGGIAVVTVGGASASSYLISPAVFVAYQAF